MLVVAALKNLKSQLALAFIVFYFTTLLDT